MCPQLRLKVGKWCCSECIDSTRERPFSVGDFYAYDRKHLGAGGTGKVWVLVEAFADSAEEPGSNPQVLGLALRPGLCQLHAVHTVCHRGMHAACTLYSVSAKTALHGLGHSQACRSSAGACSRTPIARVRYASRACCAICCTVRYMRAQRRVARAGRGSSPPYRHR